MQQGSCSVVQRTKVVILPSLLHLPPANRRT